MVYVVFVVGCPGSGKSQISRCITGEAWLSKELKQVENCLPPNWTACRFTDYTFLRNKFLEEKKQCSILAMPLRRFECSEHDGFRVKDFTILDEALLQMNQSIVTVNDPHKLLLVEFARDNYYPIIWNAFDSSFVKEAHVLYIKTSFDECIKRINRRVKYKISEDDTFVPDDILEGYYHTDHTEHSEQLEDYFGKEKVTVIDNNGEWAQTWSEVKRFVQALPLNEKASSRELVGV